MQQHEMGLIAGLALVTMALFGPQARIGSACEPDAFELAVRARVQTYLDMFPHIYDDIIEGRLKPNRLHNQYGTINQVRLAPAGTAPS